MQVKRVAIASLKLWPQNARKHGPVNHAAIRASLERFGQAEPLVVQASTMQVIGGNGRLAAMREIGWTECDIVILDLDDQKAAALGVALNRTGELAEWDEPVLAEILKQLDAAGALAGVGFSHDEIDELLAKVSNDALGNDAVEDPGPGEPPAMPTSRTGDLWLLGEHRLLCGDSTKAQDVARALGGERAALLSTDPPYCVDYTGNDRPVHDGKPSGKDWSHVYREVDIKDFGTFLDEVFRAALPHVGDDAAVYIWHAHVQQPVIAATFAKHNLLLHQVLVWVKPVATFGHGYYRWKHEPCAFGWKRGHKPAHGFGQMETVWECDWEGKARMVGNEHPTMKPTRLFEIPMEQHTSKGAVVLELFSGSGSQLIAAERLGRRCRALEIAPTFVDVAVRRWEKATGRAATLDGTGETFAKAAEQRKAEVDAEPASK